MIETLNNYHALTITKMEVENRFDDLIPHYKKETEKHYVNLLSSVYNTMLTGYMPDYTCLVTPIFRAYEFYLHKILGEFMELETERDNGTNKFSYFSKNNVGKYECNHGNVEKLNAQQTEYLNSIKFVAVFFTIQPQTFYTYIISLSTIPPRTCLYIPHFI